MYQNLLFITLSVAHRITVACQVAIQLCIPLCPNANKIFLEDKNPGKFHHLAHSPTAPLHMYIIYIVYFRFEFRILVWIQLYVG